MCNNMTSCVLTNFVTGINTVRSRITSFVFRNTRSFSTPKHIRFGTRTTFLIAIITTFIQTIALPILQNTFIICTLEKAFFASSNGTIWNIFIRSIRTVFKSITSQIVRNANRGIIQTLTTLELKFIFAMSSRISASFTIWIDQISSWKTLAFGLAFIIDLANILTATI